MSTQPYRRPLFTPERAEGVAAPVEGARRLAVERIEQQHQAEQPEAPQARPGRRPLGHGPVQGHQ
ncbi:hypothetical protein ACIRPK_34040 [Kitasatospora sp. NPDC101801]|uniref:hypothetical protein n=1 Tax=Kitasatospora sp. NPDC101801 TaxID=3364103 RepID=UPI003813ED6F